MDLGKRTTTNRERLLELFKTIKYAPFPGMKPEISLANQFSEHALNCIIDELLANGVIVLPCKLGAKVWFIKKDRVPDDDYRMNFHNEWIMGETFFQLSMVNQWGRTVFPSPEVAETALKERNNNE